MFFQNVIAKITKYFNYGNLHSERTQNLWRAVYFLPKFSGFANKASFAPKLTISAIH